MDGRSPLLRLPQRRLRRFRQARSRQPHRPRALRTSRRRLLRCSTCKTRFSERKGTPLFDSRLPDDAAQAVLAHVAEGVGTRKTARLVGIHPDTITRYTRLAGPHAQLLHDELVTFSPSNPQGAVR